MTDTYERCSCGSRDRAKCSKEGLSGGGKMCLKPEDSLFINFRDTLNGGWAVDIDYESDAWQKVLNDWSEFKSQCVPIPKELFERMGVIKKKAEENRLRGQTVLNADIATEMLDNPKAPNDKLMELLEGK